MSNFLFLCYCLFFTWCFYFRHFFRVLFFSSMLRSVEGVSSGKKKTKGMKKPKKELFLMCALAKTYIEEIFSDLITSYMWYISLPITTNSLLTCGPLSILNQYFTFVSIRWSTQINKTSTFFIVYTFFCCCTHMITLAVSIYVFKRWQLNCVERDENRASGDESIFHVYSTSSVDICPVHKR